MSEPPVSDSGLPAPESAGAPSAAAAHRAPEAADSPAPDSPSPAGAAPSVSTPETPAPADSAPSVPEPAASVPDTLQAPSATPPPPAGYAPPAPPAGYAPPAPPAGYAAPAGYAPPTTAGDVPPASSYAPPAPPQGYAPPQFGAPPAGAPGAYPPPPAGAYAPPPGGYPPPPTPSYGAPQGGAYPPPNPQYAPPGGYPPPGAAQPPAGAYPPPSGYPPAGQPGAPSTIQFDSSKATTSDWIVIGAGLVLLVFSFFGWLSVSFTGTLSGISGGGSTGAWNEYWWIATVLGVAAAVVVALRVLFAQPLPQVKPLYLVGGAAVGFVITLIAMIEIFTRGGSGLGFSVGPGFGIWVCLIVSAAQTYFLWLWGQKQPGWTLPKLPAPANF